MGQATSSMPLPNTKEEEEDDKAEERDGQQQQKQQQNQQSQQGDVNASSSSNHAIAVEREEGEGGGEAASTITTPEAISPLEWHHKVWDAVEIRCSNTSLFNLSELKCKLEEITGLVLCLRCILYASYACSPLASLIHIKAAKVSNPLPAHTNTGEGIARGDRGTRKRSPATGVRQRDEYNGSVQAPVNTRDCVRM